MWDDVAVLACPIYSWYCPTLMKSVLDRHYGLNKFYGSATGSLWSGNKAALFLTHGYDREYACTPFETGVKNLCVHSSLEYIGMYSAGDIDNKASMHTKKAVEGAKLFVRKIAGERPDISSI
ncbi:MAG TPA: NAD(P)H-dependent oxidoreductase [Clostridiaceae bacterium]|nr:NAD(P)H-dependent oxidoreductase [Clostridiaceae bacterium]